MAATQHRSTDYYVHTIPGIEGIARDELADLLPDMQLAGFKTVPERNGLVLFSTSEPAERLLSLRVAEDAFVTLGRLPEIPWGREGLEMIERNLGTVLGLNHGLNVLETTRQVHRNREIRFRTITRISGTGQPYRRVDVTLAVARAIRRRSRQQWKAVESGEDVEVWVNLLGREVLVGLRLSDETMRHRDYQKVHLPASLRPSVAAAMVRLSAPRANDIFLDPMCGTGTLVIERGLAHRHGLLLGGDIDRAALAAAAENLGPRHKPRELLQWDARQLPLCDASVDCIACNLPFGKQLSSPRQLPGLYQGVLSEIARLLRPGGRAVLLTSAISVLREQVPRVGGLALGRRYPVNILGQNATIQTLSRTFDS
ncbi:MAG: methyltransferase domain-containing protein [Anaerolineae bacterium]|nr:methyltransferase domain-containing protein [Chloroflexota bacterium]